MNELSEELIKEINARCPVSFNQAELDKRLSNARVRFDMHDRYVSKSYRSTFELLTELPQMMKSGFNVDPAKSKAIGSGYYSLKFEQPKKQEEKALKELLEDVEATYQAELDEAKAAWIDTQINDHLEAQKLADIERAAKETEQFKLRLLEAMKH